MKRPILEDLLHIALLIGLCIFFTGCNEAGSETSAQLLLTPYGSYAPKNPNQICTRNGDQWTCVLQTGPFPPECPALGWITGVFQITGTASGLGPEGDTEFATEGTKLTWSPSNTAFSMYFQGMNDVVIDLEVAPGSCALLYERTDI